MPAAKPLFANRYETRRIGNYKVAYDTILDHDTYSWLRVSYEVDRTQDNKTTVVFNGRPIGEVSVVRRGGKVIGYRANRISGNAMPEIPQNWLFKHIGHAGASLISSYVEGEPVDPSFFATAE
jgi:hypothetical protein